MLMVESTLSFYDAVNVAPLELLGQEQSFWINVQGFYSFQMDSFCTSTSLENDSTKTLNLFEFSFEKIFLLIIANIVSWEFDQHNRKLLSDNSVALIAKFSTCFSKFQVSKFLLCSIFATLHPPQWQGIKSYCILKQHRKNQIYRFFILAQQKLMSSFEIAVKILSS